MSSLLRFFAPGLLSFRHGEPGAAVTALLLHALGLAGASLAVTAAGLFPPLALLLWLCYQAVLVSCLTRSGIDRGGDPVPGLVPVALAALAWSGLWLAAVLLVAAELRPAALAADVAFPGAPAETLLFRPFGSDELPLRGDLVVVACARQGRGLARVIALPGEEVRATSDGRVCTRPGCFPQRRFSAGPDPLDVAAGVEVLGDRFHLLFFGPAAGRDYSPLFTLPPDTFAVFPDFRDSTAFLACRAPGPIPRSDLLGTARWVLLSPNLSRIGLRLK
jgi:hypothetical protein